MQEIPETGGGLAGFIAWLLWQVYQYFPFEGTWDWLLMMFVLAVACHVAFLPHLWKCVQADMEIFSQGKVLSKDDLAGYQMLPFFFNTFCMWLLIWFFHSPAGRTLLEGRAWLGSGAPGNTARGFFWVSLTGHLVLCLLMLAFWEADPRQKAPQADRSGPFSDRSLKNLYLGGGVFVQQTKKGTLHRDLAPPPLAVELAFVILPAYLFYWYWSIASLNIMLCFTIAGALNEAVRMCFVYVLHKKTFG